MPYDENIHQVFAKNLRRHCESQPSIAAICAATKINRQQFNKYLSGKVLPGSLNLRIICEFLGIQEEELFRRRGSSKNGARAAQLDTKANIEMVSNLFGLPISNQEFEFKTPGLSEGYYYCYFPLVERAGLLLRSLVWVYSKDQQLHFVRITSILGRSNLSAKRVRGRHSGIVFSNANDIFMMAFNRYAKGQLTVSVFHKPIHGSGGELLSGQSLTRSPEGLRALWTVLVPIPDGTPVRIMLNRLGVCAEHDPSVDIGVRMAFPDTRYI